MAGSVNKVILVGNLGRDPETRQTQDGKPIANFTVATNETWKDRQSGERRERVEWHRVVIFNEHLAEIAQRYLHKGSKVYLEGQLQTRKWTDQSGQERYTTEVVLQRFRASSRCSTPARTAAVAVAPATTAGASRQAHHRLRPKERPPTWTTTSRSDLRSLV